MSYNFLPGEPYRMPTHFGPATGPRRGPDGRRFSSLDTPRTTVAAVRFRSDREKLAALLPPRFELQGEPVVTLTATYMTDIEWLAGRGYNMLGVSFPAVFQGKTEATPGQFLAVLWENLTEPIITGREELGYAKIYCDLPEPTSRNDTLHCSAEWMGFRFLDLTAGPLRELSPEERAERGRDEPPSGKLHYKYVPRTSDPGRADASYAVYTPPETPNLRVLSVHGGPGSFQFHAARWEDMPTQYMIVNTLRALPVEEMLGATVTRTTGGKDLSDMRILE